MELTEGHVSLDHFWYRNVWAPALMPVLKEESRQGQRHGFRRSKFAFLRAMVPRVRQVPTH